MATRVLVVDDEPNIVTSLEFLLQDAGFEVRTASNGQEALEQTAQFAPDLILLDIMMPVLNGYEVCQRLKSDPKTRGVRVLMLSAKGRDVEIAKGRELGADAYMTKPFATRDLLVQVQDLLSR